MACFCGQCQCKCMAPQTINFQIDIPVQLKSAVYETRKSDLRSSNCCFQVCLWQTEPFETHLQMMCSISLAKHLDAVRQQFVVVVILI